MHLVDRSSAGLPCGMSVTTYFLTDFSYFLLALISHYWALFPLSLFSHCQYFILTSSLPILTINLMVRSIFCSWDILSMLMISMSVVNQVKRSLNLFRRVVKEAFCYVISVDLILKFLARASTFTSITSSTNDIQVFFGLAPL